MKTACASWLASIPLDFFINDANPFFHCNQGISEDGIPNNPNALFLDHERCIAAFEQMQLLRSYQRPVTPVNHTILSDTVEIVSTTTSPVSVSTVTTTVTSACDYLNTTTTTTTSSSGGQMRELKRPKLSPPSAITATIAGSLPNNNQRRHYSEAEDSPPKRARNNENMKN